MWNPKIQKTKNKLMDTENTLVVSRRKGGMIAEMGEAVKRHKLPTLRKVGPGHVMYGMVTRVDNTALYI